MRGEGSGKRREVRLGGAAGLKAKWSRNRSNFGETSLIEVETSWQGGGVTYCQGAVYGKKSLEDKGREGNTGDAQHKPRRTGKEKGEGGPMTRDLSVSMRKDTSKSYQKRTTREGGETWPQQRKKSQK